MRCHMGTYGGNFDGKQQKMVKPDGAPDGAYFHPKMYMERDVYKRQGEYRCEGGYPGI